MNNLNILVISINPDLLEVILRLVNNRETWKGTGAESIEQSKEKFQEDNFDIVLYDVGVTEDNEKELTQFFKNLKPDVITIKHYGGGSGLLYNEIQAALES